MLGPELDLTLGGDMPPGASLLLQGGPGAGKSTLALQAAGCAAHAGLRAMYLSSEESTAALRGRAARLGVSGVFLEGTATPWSVASRSRLRPGLLVVDSLQHLASPHVHAAPALLGWLCASAQALGARLLIVSRANQAGQTEGARALEHVPDGVLRLAVLPSGVRVGRLAKWRHGATERPALWRMGGAGLAPIPDPSAALMGEAAGIVAALYDGRPVLAPVQARVGPPKGARVVGLSSARTAQLAPLVWEALGVGAPEGYSLRVLGGLGAEDPGADLPAALALACAALGAPPPPVAAWGEVGLDGRILTPGGAELREREAERFGLPLLSADTLADAVAMVAANNAGS